MISRFNSRYYQVVKHVSCSECSTSILLSEADTFIEFCFEKTCSQMKDGLKVLNEWRYHKEQYCRITDTTVYDFQHYSWHDASHSVSVLEAMEMIIGDQRLVTLSRGDLWLLLESAYSHDIGMALTGKEFIELWGDKEFKNYILSCLASGKMDSEEAANYYSQMNNTINGKNQMNGLVGEAIRFDDYWPAHISRYVEWLVTEYIRSHHAERNKRVRERIISIPDSVIPKRLYEQVVVINELHTDESEHIMTRLPWEEKGIGAEMMHPRFVAVMLRMGDVLDVENNRFSVYAMEHMGKIPHESMVHYGKHDSIRLIQISEEEIHVEAVSNDLEVCHNTSLWFQMIDETVDELINSWNVIVPEQLKGCRLKKSHCKVFFKNKDGAESEYEVGRKRTFEVNRQKLIDLMTGTNIYDTNIDFIREYLQNAMDAAKM